MGRPKKTIDLPELQVHASRSAAPNIADIQGTDFEGIDNIVPKFSKSFGEGSWGAIALGVANIVANLFGNDMQYKRQKELLAIQQQYAKQNWEMENQYNLPENVKARLMAAGLNPNLMYGQGAASGQGGTISPQGSPEAFYGSPMSGVSSIIQAMQQAKLTDSQADLNKSLAEKNRSDVQRNDAEINKISSEIERLGVLNDFTEQSRQKILRDMAEIDSRIELMTAQEFHEYVKSLKDMIDYQFSVESFESRLGYSKTMASEAAADAKFAWSTLETRINQENVSLQQQKAELRAMIPALFEAAVYDEYIDDDGNLSDKGERRKYTDLSMDRLEQVVEAISTGMAAGSFAGLLGRGSRSVVEKHVTTKSSYNGTTTDTYIRKRRPKRGKR